LVALEQLRDGRVGGLLIDRSAWTPALSVLAQSIRQRRLAVPIIEILTDVDNAPSALSDAHWISGAAMEELIALTRTLSIVSTLRAAQRLQLTTVDPQDQVDAALCALFSRVPPYGTVDELARAARSSQATIVRRWKMATSAHPAGRRLRLHDVITAVRFLRAISNKSPHSTWRAAANQVGMSYETLRRTGQIFGVQLERLSREPLAPVKWFEREILASLGISIVRAAF
jgi:hypothetical protein